MRMEQNVGFEISLYDVQRENWSEAEDSRFFLDRHLKLAQRKIGTEFNQPLHLNRNKGGSQG
jgi:hypothetical protein